jgi:SnoaL-like domain
VALGPVKPTIEELAGELAQLRTRVETSESILQIHALKARYADLVDRRFSKGKVVDQETLGRIAREIADLFTPDGVWDGGPGLGVATGRAAIVERLERPTLTFSRHLFVKPMIEVQGDHASATWDLLCPCQREDGASFWMCGSEADRYLRVDGSWLHETMTLTSFFMAPVADGFGNIFT